MSLVPSNLRYVPEAARLGSIRKASEHLNISPSAAYRSIQNMEFELGAPLFERTSKRVVPTSSGSVLVAYAERMLTEGARTVDRIKTLTQRNLSISAAGPEGTVPEILATCIDSF